jgi:ParB-like chromosome segregation protein Spo0J
MRIDTVPLTRIRPNDWNPNHMKPEMRRALSAMYDQIGYVQPILVRESSPGEYEIIDGEHRYDELRSRGAEEAEVVIADVDAYVARQATLAMNQIHGRAVPILLAKVMLDVERELGTEGLKAAGFADKDIKKAHELADPAVGKLADPEKLAEPRRFEVTLAPGQYDEVMQAIARAKVVAETDSDAAALVALAQEFLSTYPEDGDGS